MLWNPVNNLVTAYAASRFLNVRFFQKQSVSINHFFQGPGKPPPPQQNLQHRRCKYLYHIFLLNQVLFSRSITRSV